MTPAHWMILLAAWPLIGLIVITWVRHLGRDLPHEVIERPAEFFGVLATFYLWPLAVARGIKRLRE